MDDILKLYNNPLPANRSGALYNAFPYPTKISPEAVALYIACHTKIGDTVLDPFAGSGSTGLATLLCDNPTEQMINTAKQMDINPVWGKRKAVLYELSTMGAFLADVMCNPPSALQFKKVVAKYIKEVESELSSIYKSYSKDNKEGQIRYIIWSDVLICPKCQKEHAFSEIAVQKNPLAISDEFNCPSCNFSSKINKVEKATEVYNDTILREKVVRKKRVPYWIYGKSGKNTWNRKANDKDAYRLNEQEYDLYKSIIPEYKINWGVLYRKGYHKGITHLHHFYTERNSYVFAYMWNKIESFPQEYQKALKLLLLSYNSSHSTLMSRVVVKQNNNDFVITGSQSGVLYISSLPVEKNIIEGVKRKVNTLLKAFTLVEKSNSSVSVINGSSTNLKLKDCSIDYIFTDPPFGDYIPYSEINQINEAWLKNVTNSENEAIINSAQNKGLEEYETLMKKVFSELNRVLKKQNRISLVFHSAKAEVWRTLINSYSSNGFKVDYSSILDKVQGSFKQVTSAIKVQGDPILLLSKKEITEKGVNNSKYNNESEIIEGLIKQAFSNNSNLEEQKPERLFSRYINACLESGISIQKDAKEFYSIINQEHIQV